MTPAEASSLCQLPDEELVSRALGGGREAFDVLVVRHERRLFRFLARAARCAADAEDAMQQALVKAYTGLHRYDPRWRFTTWLFTIALRELRTLGRRAAAGPRAGPIDGAADLARSPAADPAAALAEREAGAGLWALARRVLAPAQHTALWLRYGEDLPPKEVARVMGRPRVWVSVTLYRALGVLRPLAGAEGGVEGGAPRRPGPSAAPKSNPAAQPAGGVS